MNRYLMNLVLLLLNRLQFAFLCPFKNVHFVPVALAAIFENTHFVPLSHSAKFANTHFLPLSHSVGNCSFDVHDNLTNSQRYRSRKRLSTI